MSWCAETARPGLILVRLRDMGEVATCVFEICKARSLSFMRALIVSKSAGISFSKVSEVLAVIDRIVRRVETVGVPRLVSHRAVHSFQVLTVVHRVGLRKLASEKSGHFWLSLAAQFGKSLSGEGVSTSCGMPLYSLRYRLINAHIAIPTIST